MNEHVHLDRVAVTEALAGFEPRRALVPDATTDTQAPPRAASVAIVLLDDGRGSRVVPITMRPTAMRAHPGQFALPGGRVDTGESGADAARRELAEELGIAVAPEDVLGRLDDYVTRSGYVITPFVLWSEAGPDAIEPNPDEVAAVFSITAEELAATPRFVDIPESRKPVIQWPFREYLVHAPTGAIVHQFAELVVRGSHTRVDGFDQPVFAWK